MASLSRTYRPQTFADITDQQPIKDTLRLEVETGKLGHAYLFGGPRGVGKTTTARIFAKALNCLEPAKGEPCNICANCAEFNSGNAIDIIEMDAASNTGVDNVREAIIEHVRFAPVGRKYKVYILDEAHMLSTSAWNALLKTLEEPPAYAVFILITTELHKVPATIQSRCQRFDFKRVPEGPLGERVTELAKRENVKIDPAVVATIVAKADGCVRDAESLLGQLLVLGEKEITPDIASLVLPVSRLPLAAEILEGWSKRELGPALRKIEEVEESGVPLLPLMDDLIQAIRQLLLAVDTVEWRQRLARGDEGERRLATLVTNFEPAELADMALALMERRRDAKQGADVRFCLELAASAVALGILPHGPNAVQTPSVTIPSVPASAPAPAPSSRPASVEQGAPSSGTPLKKEIPAAFSTPRAPAPVRAPAPTTSVPAESAPASSGVEVTLGQIQSKWPAIIRTMDGKSPSLTFVLRISRPISVTNNVVMLEFQYPYHREKIVGDLKARRMVEDCLREVVGVSDLRLDGIVGEESGESKEERRKDTVNTILEAFGGQIVEEGGEGAST